MTLPEALLLVQKRVVGKKYHKQLEDCISLVKEGKSMCEAMDSILTHMNGGVVVSSILKSTEKTGDYALACKKIYQYLESKEDIKREFIEVVTYPTLISVVSLVITYGIVSFIFPKIIPLFTSLNVTIPASTKYILQFVNFVERNSVYILFSVTLISLCVRYLYMNYQDVRVFIQKILLHVPGFKKIAILQVSIVISSAIATLVSSGKTLFESVHIIAEDIYFIPIQTDFNYIIARAEQGVALYASFSESTYFTDPVWIDYLLIGERTGKIDNACTQINAVYLDELLVYKKIFKTWSEPVLMFFIALIVLFIALSVIQPMYSIINHVSAV